MEKWGFERFSLSKMRVCLDSWEVGTASLGEEDKKGNISSDNGVEFYAYLRSLPFCFFLGEVVSGKLVHLTTPTNFARITINSSIYLNLVWDT